jgi:hypothetical protein
MPREWRVFDFVAMVDDTLHGFRVMGRTPREVIEALCTGTFDMPPDADARAREQVLEAVLQGDFQLGRVHTLDEPVEFAPEDRERFMAQLRLALRDSARWGLRALTKGSKPPGSRN